ncbi:dTMP kinase [Akkermansiaceae bacterium]|jgi:dTMP kinase|nr:dTMP kinase [Akkermansiaceae bacterium]
MTTKHNSLEAKGYLIVIEGIDGTGKSTQATMLAEALRKSGREVVQSFEPTNGPWGKKLRDSATTGRLSIEDELEYFINDRREHVEQLIIPTIKSGGIVILDRYYFSTMAYQGARGIDPEVIRVKNETFAPQPDTLIILDLDVDIALQRIGVRDGQANEFEKRESLDFCRKLFLSLKDETYAYVIDANTEITEVNASVMAAVHAQLGIEPAS